MQGGNQTAERAILVGWGSDRENGSPARRIDRRLDELERLVHASGGTVVGRIAQVRQLPGLGSGKLAEARRLIVETAADLAVVDGEISAGQARQWEDRLGVRVIDRTDVILDIFARRATSPEGRLEVELAQLTYRLPRLTDRPRMMSRQGGGIGTRGPGETRLESDRRRIRQRLARLRRDLERLEAERRERRARRRRNGVPVVALVGYTNVGKSTLFQALARQWAPTADALFVTLDPRVRRVHVPGFGMALLVDTVGFISRLPHTLVAAFRSTLDEVREATLLVEVTNAASPTRDLERQAVQEVLTSLGAEKLPRIEVAAQWDRAHGKTPVVGLPVSARTGYNLEALTGLVAERLGRERPVNTVLVPWEAGEVLGWLQADGDVLSQEAHPEGITVVYRAGPAVVAKVWRRVHQAGGGQA